MTLPREQSLLSTGTRAEELPQQLIQEGCDPEMVAIVVKTIGARAVEDGRVIVLEQPAEQRSGRQSVQVTGTLPKLSDSESGDLRDSFGGQKAAYAALGLSRRDWSRLGRLANDEPLRQGRHRGKKMGQLRDATPDELKEAQAIAVAMIEGYLKYVQRH